MTIIICPGVHPPAFTHSFLAGLAAVPQRLLVFPADRHPPYSPYHLLQFLRDTVADPSKESLLFVGFSAGVVAAWGAANVWQAGGGAVHAVLSLDGWGVPQWGTVPLYRISHDAFTHWSAACLGGSHVAFYADPPVAHLELWRSPQTTVGWRVCASPRPSRLSIMPAAKTYDRLSAAQFIETLLKQYGEI
jgi:hypothetical protein